MKRVVDILFSTVVLITLALPLLVFGLAVKFRSPGPALYWSKRIGRDETIFFMPKLRTMYLNAPLEPTSSLNNPEKHITPVGRFLRATSIDEFPQFYSVLKGDMSLVGPRPVIQAEKYIIQKRTQCGVNHLRPGITGWAQINGRDDLSDDQKVDLDLFYLLHQSLLLDLRIILHTVVYVLKERG